MRHRIRGGHRRRRELRRHAGLRPSRDGDLAFASAHVARLRPLQVRRGYRPRTARREGRRAADGGRRRHLGPARNFRQARRGARFVRRVPRGPALPLHAPRRYIPRPDARRRRLTGGGRAPRRAAPARPPGWRRAGAEGAGRVVTRG